MERFENLMEVLKRQSSDKEVQESDITREEQIYKS